MFLLLKSNAVLDVILLNTLLKRYYLNTTSLFACCNLNIHIFPPCIFANHLVPYCTIPSFIISRDICYDALMIMVIRLRFHNSCLDGSLRQAEKKTLINKIW